MVSTRSLDFVFPGATPGLETREIFENAWYHPSKTKNETTKHLAPKPGSVRPGPGQVTLRLGQLCLTWLSLGPARHESAQVGLARLGLAWLGSAKLDSAQLGSALGWFGSDRTSLAELGSGRHGCVRLGLARFCFLF